MKTLILFLMGMLIDMHQALAASWPDIPFPDDARVESVGDQVRLNGIPMRMHRVLSRKPPNDLLGFYREALGTRHAEQRLPDSRVLSQERNHFFITVRLRPLSVNLTEVLVSMSDLQAARNSVNRPLGFKLPADSAVLSDMESTDAGKRSRQLVASNRHAIPTNLDAFSRELAARGMHPDGPPLHKSASEHVQLYKGDKREAQLTLVRREGETGVVLTTIDTP